MAEAIGQPVAGRSASVAGQVFDLLLDRIMTFELKPYERISEKKLSDAIGVSRTPVREALARLSALGLLDIYAQRGTVVAPLRMRDLQRSQFLREALEIALLPRAIASPNRPQLATRLNNELALQETLAAIGDHKRFYSSDELFHSLIATYADLGDIWGDISAAKLHMDRFRHLTFPTVDGMPLVIGQHRAIVAAIEKGDADEAAAAMRAHLRRIFGVLDIARARFPGFFADEHATRGMPSRDARPAEADKAVADE